jgi:hypothetical protein
LKDDSRGGTSCTSKLQEFRRMMLFRLLVIASGLVTPAFTRASESEAISLRCDGIGYDAIQTGNSSAAIVGPQGITGLGSSKNQEAFRREMTVLFRSSDGKAELNVKGKWLPVKKLLIKSDEITGSTGSHWTGKFTFFRIDRVSGAIASEDGYSGTCQRNENAVTKF